MSFKVLSLSIFLTSLFYFQNAIAEEYTNYGQYAEASVDFKKVAKPSIQDRFAMLLRYEQIWRAYVAANDKGSEWMLQRAISPIEFFFSEDGQFPIDTQELGEVIQILSNIDTDIARDMIERLDKSMKTFTEQVEDASLNYSKYVDIVEEGNEAMANGSRKILSPDFIEGLKEVAGGAKERAVALRLRGESVALDATWAVKALTDLHEVVDTVMAIRAE